MEAKETKNTAPASATKEKKGKKKKTNRTWQAMMKYQGAFTVIAPEFRL